MHQSLGAGWNFCSIELSVQESTSLQQLLQPLSAAPLTLSVRVNGDRRVITLLHRMKSEERRILVELARAGSVLEVLGTEAWTSGGLQFLRS